MRNSLYKIETKHKNLKTKDKNQLKAENKV